MTVIPLSLADIGLAASLVLGLAGLSLWQQLGVTRQVLVAALRCGIQLALVGLVLKWLFENLTLWGLGLVVLVMVAMAGREVVGRQTHRWKRGWGFGIGTGAMMLSSVTLTLFALLVLVQPDPWYRPQYAIPLLGMLLGNTMNGVALGCSRLTQEAWRRRDLIEARLILGHTAAEAVAGIRKDSIRTGLIPILNAMSIAGLVSLPGMMTGQILSGSPPMEAVKYQVLILFLIAGGTGLGTITAVFVSARLLFDDRQRLRLDRLTARN